MLKLITFIAVAIYIAVTAVYLISLLANVKKDKTPQNYPEKILECFLWPLNLINSFKKGSIK